MTKPREGETRTFERTFTVGDVQQFAEVSRDDQARHTESDEDGRVMVQGLLTATLPTKLGSDSEVLATDMHFQFHQPVYTGERITCRSTYDTVVEREDRYDLTFETVCENENGETVLTATIEGLVWKEE